MFLPFFYFIEWYTEIMKLLILMSSFMVLVSCSSFDLFGNKKSEAEDILAGYKRFTNDDYLAQLKVLHDFYQENPEVRIVKTNKRSSRYIKKLIRTIITNNELFFKRIDANFDVYIVDDTKPFYFSLPNQKLYISSGVINKYLKSENLLYCLLTYELIRNEKLIFRKVNLIPKGIIETSQMLSLLRIETGVKVEIHKWAFYILKRSGLSTDNYLSWLQIQNRNSIDFKLLMGDVNSISEEEALFKLFLIRNQKKTQNTKKYTSSRSFYNFINYVKKKSRI
jgi:hypothetical protein